MYRFKVKMFREARNLASLFPDRFQLKTEFSEQKTFSIKEAFEMVVILLKQSQKELEEAKEKISWFQDRCIHVHGENKNLDFLQKEKK